MSRRPSKPAWAIIGAAVLVLAGVLVAVAVGVHSGGPHKAAQISVAAKTIPGTDGADLKAYVIAPGGDGPFPLLVMPGAWGTAANRYVTLGRTFAANGYVVVCYSERGIAGSTGEADLAGSQAQRDVSAVITWALAHTPSDADKIGAVGSSFGAGMSLLAAERDPRIRAVVATSTWTDLSESYFANQTPSSSVLMTLLQNRNAQAGLDAQARRLRSALQSADPVVAGDVIGELDRSSSPIDGVDKLNAHGTAVMIANGWEDSIFPPEQLIDFFDALTAPKRLQLATGDHGGPERSGLLGRKNLVWTDAQEWFDHYLRGEDTAIARQQPVQLYDIATGVWHGYADWAQLGKPVTYHLGQPGAADTSGGLSTTAPTSWTDTINAGIDSGANTAPSQFNALVPYRHPSVVPDRLPATRAAVWNGPVFEADTLVNGSAQLSLTVTPSAATTSLFAYLYDVDGSGTGTLMSYEPYTLLDVTPGASRPVRMTLQPVSWTVPQGHHLSLVIDTVDPRYMRLSRPGSTVRFSSSAADPATLAVPIG